MKIPAIATREITVDKELKNLLPKLTTDEYDRLEKDILANGCKMPLVYYESDGDNILVDGHNRFAICMQYKLHFELMEAPEVRNKSDAKIWILTNQVARRNLDPLTRIKLALQLKHLYGEKAKKNQGHGQTAPGKSLCQNSEKAIHPIDTNKELSKIAGVSSDTVARADRIFRSASEGQKKRLETGASINAIYNEICQKKSKNIGDNIESFIKRFRWAAKRELMPIGHKLMDLFDELSDKQKKEAINTIEELWEFSSKMSQKFNKFKNEGIHH